MDNTETDLIASLGLSAASAPADVTAAQDAADDAEVATKPTERKPALKIDAAQIVKGRGRLPALRRGGGGGGNKGSKYPFDELAAPTEATDEEGTYFEFDNFEIRLAAVENADEARLRSALTAAVATQNKKEKEANSGKRFVTRSLLDDAGAYAGVAVYRVDDKDEDGDEEETKTETASA